MSEVDRARLAIPDVNVLVALTNESHVSHREAHRWFGAVSSFATTPLTEAGLLRMLLNPVVIGRALPVDAALAVVRGVLADSRALFVPDDLSLADETVSPAGLTGHKQVTDWHLVLLAQRHRGRLVTFDRKIERAFGPSAASSILTLG